MTPSFLRNCACASLLGVSALGLHAAPLTLAGSGTTVDFYFDAGFWGSAPAFTVVGDNIRFDGIGLSAFTPGGTSGGSDRQSFNALPGQAALVAVARAGFDFGGGYSANLGFRGSYALQGSGLVAAAHGADLYAGNFGSGAFGGTSLLASLSALSFSRMSSLTRVTLARASPASVRSTTWLMSGATSLRHCVISKANWRRSADTNPLPSTLL